MTLTWTLVVLAFVFVAVVWFQWRSTVRVPCALDLERTHDHFHAHVELLGILVEPGDAVQIEEGAPQGLEYGEIRKVEGKAVVKRASWLRRKWTRMVGALEFYELYDVGFE